MWWSPRGTIRNVGRTVAILNQKGGVGKTTVTLGLVSAAASAGDRVLVADLDPQGSTTWALGIDPLTVEISMAEVLGRSSAESAIQATDWADTIDVLPASPRLQAREQGAPGRLGAALASLADKYDAVLLDCPPSLANLTRSALSASNQALIVVEPSALGLRGIGAVADMVDDVWDTDNPNLALAGVVVNRVPAVSAEADRRYDELTRIVGKKAVWQPSIPQRVIVGQAINERTPIHGYGARAAEVSAAFDELWARLRALLRQG
jgi:chromosome partitioning protein